MSVQTIRTTLNLKRDLLERVAQNHPHLSRTAALEEGLRALLARDAAERLAALGGTAPKAKAPRRRGRPAR